MKRLVVVTAILSILLLAGTATARDESPGTRGSRAERQGRNDFSASQAADVARKRTGGRVLAVKAVRDGYQVRMLTPGGEVRNVFVSGGDR